MLQYGEARGSHRAFTHPEHRMRSQITRTLGLAATALALATSAQAQGRGHGRGSDHAALADRRSSDDDHDRDRDRDVYRGDIHRRDTHDIYRRDDGDIYRGPDRDIYGNGRWVPPGLAKKPGQMPPGQYKKLYGNRQRYGAYQGASVLSEILRGRGYPVLRVAPAGGAQYVYYRLHDGPQRRAIVSPGSDRLLFDNVPASILQAVLSRLY